VGLELSGKHTVPDLRLRQHDPPAARPRGGSGDPRITRTGLEPRADGPNPATGTVRLHGATAESATLLDATGRTVRVWHLAPSTSDLSLAGLTPGVYSVRCGTTARRLVVE
jgi:hypothetical protein